MSSASWHDMDKGNQKENAEDIANTVLMGVNLDASLSDIRSRQRHRMKARETMNFVLAEQQYYPVQCLSGVSSLQNIQSV